MAQKRRPDWFDRVVDRSSGRDLDQYRLLDRLYNEIQVVKQDLFDHRKYDDILQQAEDLVEMVHGRSPDHPTWVELVQDAYLSLWKARPELLDGQEVRPSHTINLMTMDKVMGASAYEELRTWTRLDDWAAAMGTVSLAEKLAQYFDEQQDLLDQAKKVQQQEEQILAAMREMQDREERDLSDEEVEEFLDDLESSLAELGEATEVLEDAAGAQQYLLRQAVQDGIEDALESSEDVVGLVQNFGTHPGQWERLDPRVRMELAHRLQKTRKLHEIAKMIGRIKRMAVGEWSRRVIHGVDEVYDVTIGNDLEHVLASELTYLADPDSEDIFWVKYMEGTLLNYQLRGSEKANRGAIVCLVDNSGSMAGDQEIWAKGVAMALLEIAKRERRDFYGIHFGSRSELAEWYFPKGEVSLSDALDYAEFFFNGGTDFEAPIGRGVEVLETQFRDESATKGDIVMITDGECAVSPEWLTRFYNAKEQLDFKLYGCLIGWRSNVLDQLSDKMFTIQDITSGGDVKEAFTLL